MKALLSLALALAANAVCLAQMDPNAVVATVNGEEIKSGEFWHFLAWYRVDPSNPLSRLPVGFLALKQLITERLIFQMAKEKGVTPTAPEIDAEEQDEISANPNLLEDEYKSYGRPEADFRHDVAYRLAQYRLRTYGVTITDQEVEQHYHDYPSRFMVPKRYKLRVIVVGDDAMASQVDKELSGGQSFSEVAKAHSLDVSKANGGEFGDVDVDHLGKSVRGALDNVKIGGTSAWVKGGDQNSVRVKYLIEDIVPEKLRPLNPELKKEIRRQLSLDRGDVKNAVFKDLDAATVHAKVTITQPGFAKLYEQLVKDYEAAHPKS